MIVPSNATSQAYYASVCYHTTIPEQPPGLSRLTDLGIRRYADNEPGLFASCINRNTEYRVYLDLGQSRNETPEGESVAYFDNVRAVYSNRIR